MIDIYIARLNNFNFWYVACRQYDVFIHFVPVNLPSVLTPAMLVELRAARQKAMYKDYEVLKDTEYPMQQMTGRILVFRRAGGKKEATKMKTTEVLWSDGSSSFILNLIADEKSHDEYAAAFFKLLSSFESLSSAPATKTEKDKSRDAPSPPGAN